MMFALPGAAVAPAAPATPTTPSSPADPAPDGAVPFAALLEQALGGSVAPAAAAGTADDTRAGTEPGVALADSEPSPRADARLLAPSVAVERTEPSGEAMRIAGQAAAAAAADRPGVAMSISDAPTMAPESSAAATPIVDGEPATSELAPDPAPSVDSATARVERSLDRLAPQFRTRLDRVVTRMRDELGLQVRIVETFRSQERQDALYEQGRTTPGPVVTWTRSSNHGRGLAADVRVEGAPADRAYAALARVAREEGLRTLGPTDPGHIEMPAAAPTSDTAGAPARSAQVTRIAQVAQLAQVAQVAQVAQAAQVAQVASRAQADDVAVRPRTDEDVADRADATTSIVPATTGKGSDVGTLAGTRVHASTGTDITGRIARVMALQDTVAARPTTGLTLLVEGESGAEARIRLGVRGVNVGATIDVANAVEASRLGDRIGELRAALERQGLEPALVAVREVPQLREAVDRMPAGLQTLAAAVTAETSASARQENNGGERGAGQPQRRDAGESDQRQRRNPREERK